jgi:FkbM family methyltransferase
MQTSTIQALKLTFRMLPVMGLQSLAYFFAWHRTGTTRLRIKGYRQAIAARCKSSDLRVLCDIFRNHQYHIPESVDAKSILDLGANVGYSAVYLSQRFPEALILAIEPDRENFQILSMNTQHLPNVRRMLAAVSPDGGSVKLLNENSAHWARQFLPNAADNADDRTAVKSLSMNALIDLLPAARADIIKMDVEGMEKYLFEDTSWIHRVKILCIEVHAGCWNPVFRALSKFDVDCWVSGDCIFIKFDHHA